MNMILLAVEEGRWDGPWWGGVIFLLLFGLVCALLIFKLFWFRPWRWRGDWHADVTAILNRRLAGGEITEEEYRRLKQVIGE